MMLPQLPEDRLTDIPEEFREAHSFGFLVYDQIAHLVRNAEQNNVGAPSVTFRDEADISLFRSCTDPFEFFEKSGRHDLERRTAIHAVFRALLPDMLHFVYTALIALERRKFAVALANLRKPFMEGLPILAAFCVNDQDFHQKLKSGGAEHYDGRAFDRDAKSELVRAAIRSVHYCQVFDANILVAILFDPDNNGGLNGLVDVATHYFTKRRAIATRPYNVNLIFKSPEDTDVFETYYDQIAYVLLFILALTSSHLVTMSFFLREEAEAGIAGFLDAYIGVFGDDRPHTQERRNGA